MRALTVANESDPRIPELPDIIYDTSFKAAIDPLHYVLRAALE